MQNDKSSAYLIAFDDSRVTDKRPNYFFIPPKFVHPCIIAAPYQGALNPHLTFYLQSFCVTLRKILVCYKPFFVTLASPNLLRLGIKRMNSLFCSRLFVTLALPNLLRLGIKNKQVYFVLLSTFRNFG